MQIKIGSRKSRLAIIQSELVKYEIESAFPQASVEIITMSTKGDEVLDRSLTAFGGKGVFTKELEEALLRGDIDMAVHSAKDMPMELPEGLCIGAVTARETPYDVLVTCNGCQAADLPAGSVIGTSSLRRELQFKEINPGVEVKLIRGNVETRLRKLQAGEYDGILLAAAGLKRLGLLEQDGFHVQKLPPEQMLPAAGQGILAVEIRRDTFSEVMAAIHSEEAFLALRAERAFLREIGGGCNAPCAAWCQVKSGRIAMEVMYAGGSRLMRASRSLPVGEQPELLGELLSADVRKPLVSLVGAGPGDAGLITEKGLDRIRRAEVVVYDHLAAGSLLNEAPLTAELIYAGKEASKHHMKQEDINTLLVQKACEGKRVVRLKGGDPFVFGRGGEEALALQEAGIAWEVIPGVSSAYGAPAGAAIPITHRTAASSFHVITGHEGAHKQEPVLDYETLAREEGTLVFLMGLHNLERIAHALMKNGKPQDTPAAVISQGTMGRQSVVAAPLSEIACEVRRADIAPPALIVVGRVAALRDSLLQKPAGPLSGRRILLTGTPGMAEKQAEIFREAGAEPVLCSLIHTVLTDGEALEEALRQLYTYRWIVFTSANGVNLFFDHLQEKRVDVRALARARFAVIGKGTAEALLRRGFLADFVPSSYTSSRLAEEWTPLLSDTEPVLLVRANEGLRLLPEALREKGVPYTELPLYETVVDSRREGDLQRILPGVDYVVFASASAVRAFAAMCGKEKTEVRAACIGPVTADAAREAGILPAVTAKVYTAEGLRDAILDLERERL